MDLSGTWLAAPADEDLRRIYPQTDFDDATWAEATVPGHWQSVSTLADHDGPVLYRRRFEADAADPGRRSWLVFDGVFYEADVWLDGSYVGDTEGYFVPHEFDVTDLLRGGREHVVAVEASCSPPRDLTAKRAITGVFQHWDCMDPADNPGGIWRPVRLVETGPVRISRLRVLCREATSEHAVLDLRAVLDSAEAGQARITTTVGTAVEHHVDVTLAAGENRVDWSVTIDNPQLWWPRSLGEQPLYDVGVEVTGAGAAEPSDRRTVTTGLRQVAMSNWIFTINGERLFLKGANQGPVLPRLAEATPADFKRDLALAADAGLDFLRLHGHISAPAMYDLADRAGMLLWQDFPLQWGYSRTVRAQAARQAREAVDLLGHHPSVFLWCGHNEPMALDLRPGQPVDVVRTGLRALAMQQLPTWNKTVIDRQVKRALHKADPTRPVVAHSGVWPGLASGGTDSHLYFGWYWGEEQDLAAFCAAWPRQARFVSEFGAQAVPVAADFMEPHRWPDLDWDRLAEHHALQRQFMAAQGLDPSDYPTFEAWQAATQAHQSRLIRHHIETLRRLKYRPTGGFAQFCFIDAHPAVTWSVVGHDRTPKPAYAAMAAACSPVIVVAERPDEVYEPGSAVSLDVHVVSDLRTALAGCTVTADLSWPAGHRRWRWGGDLAADSVRRIGTAAADLGPEAGLMHLDLSLADEAGVVIATNRYESVVYPS
ncbi:MAG: glycoside hydrolase family 2 protein [Acidimicrobiales bacterium]